MKALAVLAGIKENLCYHVGRHSFASLVTLEAGVPIETISSMLGHSNIQTTQVYARVTPKKLFEDMDRLIEATVVGLNAWRTKSIGFCFGTIATAHW